MLKNQLPVNPNFEQFTGPAKDFKKACQAGDHLARQWQRLVRGSFKSFFFSVLVNLRRN